MTLKWYEITDDPFVNQTNEFVLVLSINQFNTPTAPSTGLDVVASGILYDPQGISVGAAYILAKYDYFIAGSLSDEAFAHSWAVQSKILIPPGWSLTLFTRASAVQGTLEELLPALGGK